MKTGAIDTLVLGAAGYVGGELLRLLKFHPYLELRAAVSRSHAGKPLDAVFPHLRGLGQGPSFVNGADAVQGLQRGQGPVAVFSCLPHGEAAAEIAKWIHELKGIGREARVVDLSADFRLGTPERFAEVYGHAHGAPELHADFHCGLPDLDLETPAKHLVQPGCFTTAATLAAAPFVAAQLVRGPVRVSAVTGSTGSGREPKEGTHHPERHGNLYAYNPLGHRHRHEMELLLSRLAPAPVQVAFVPHSGPFARGIHATVHLDLVRPLSTKELLQVQTAFYAERPFVQVLPELPKLKEIVGTNRARVSAAADGTMAVAFSAIDNLCKGAAGGGVQWMNRRFGWPAETGLDLPALGWN